MAAIAPTNTVTPASPSTAAAASSAGSSGSGAGSVTPVEGGISSAPDKIQQLTRQIQVSGLIAQTPDAGQVTINTALGALTIVLPQLAQDQQQKIEQQLIALFQSQKPLTVVVQPGNPPMQAFLLLPTPPASSGNIDAGSVAAATADSVSQLLAGTSTPAPTALPPLAPGAVLPAVILLPVDNPAIPAALTPASLPSSLANLAAEELVIKAETAIDQVIVQETGTVLSNLPPQTVTPPAVQTPITLPPTPPLMPSPPASLIPAQPVTLPIATSTLTPPPAQSTVTLPPPPVLPPGEPLPPTPTLPPVQVPLSSLTETSPLPSPVIAPPLSQVLSPLPPTLPLAVQELASPLPSAALPLVTPPLSSPLSQALPPTTSLAQAPPAAPLFNPAAAVQPNTAPTLGNLLQPGTELSLSVNAVALPSAPPPVATLPNQIVASVIGSGPNGQLLLKAGDTTLYVSAPANAPVGSTLLLTVTPSRAAAPTLLPMPDIGNFGALQQAMATLAQADPTLARQMMESIIPQPNPALAGALLLLFNAFQQGDLRGWLGPSAADILAKFGKAELIAKLSQGLNEGGQTVNDPVVGAWRSYSVPLYTNSQFQIMHFYVHGERHWHGHGRPDDDGKNPGQKSVRFLIDMRLSKLGAMQLDGFVRPKQLDMIVRSEAALPPGLDRDLRSTYSNTLSAIGYAGTIAFQTGRQNWLFIKNPAVAGSVVT